MNTADYVDDRIAELKQQVANGGIPLSDACWETALLCIEWAYVYSAWGAYCTPTERRKRFAMCPTHTTIKTKCKAFENGICSGCQWYPGGKKTRCFDCRGFVDWVYKQFGFDLYGDTCSVQWNHKENWCAKGQIGVDPIPQNVLVSIYIKKDNKWTHTGLYYNGATCECSSGVQYFNPMKKNRWTHWAVAKCFENELNLPVKEPEKEKPVSNPVSNDYPTLRKGNKGDWVAILQQKLILAGYSLPKYGVDRDFGNETLNAVKAFQKANGLTADGVVGEKTWNKLNNVISEPVKLYTVTIKGNTKEVAEEIQAKYGGVITEE